MGNLSFASVCVFHASNALAEIGWKSALVTHFYCINSYSKEIYTKEIYILGNKLNGISSSMVTSTPTIRMD